MTDNEQGPDPEWDDLAEWHVRTEESILRMNMHIEKPQPYWLSIENNMSVEVDHAERERYQEILRQALRNGMMSHSNKIRLVGEPQKSTIERPPGSLIVTLLQAIISRPRYEKIFGQMVTDNRQLFYEALAAGDECEARKVSRELNFDLCKAVFEIVAGFPAQLLIKPFKRFFDK